MKSSAFAFVYAAFVRCAPDTLTHSLTHSHTHECIHIQAIETRRVATIENERDTKDTERAAH